MILKANNISKVYDKGMLSKGFTAVDNISLNIIKGSFVGIMGPSGAGKTTLMNILSGIDKPTTGEVEIAGRSIIKMDYDELAIHRRQHIGFVFQDFNLLDSLTVGENILLPSLMEGDGDSNLKMAKKYMKLVGIESLENKYPVNISGGEQQRASIVRAVMNKPSIVFADEPTGNLDSKSSKNIMTIFRKLNKEEDTTFLMVTHDSYAASYCDRVIFIVDGKIKLELVRGEERQQDFFEKISGSFTSLIAGDSYDI